MVALHLGIEKEEWFSNLCRTILEKDKIAYINSDLLVQPKSRSKTSSRMLCLNKFVVLIIVNIVTN
jgi:hypothetical protein